MRTCFPLFAALAFALSVAEAYGASPETGRYVKADACSVWAPTLLAGDYALHYRGACAKGVAEGEGRAEWRKDGKVSLWEGKFRNGIFVGQAAGITRIFPLSHDHYLVAQGKIAEASLWFVSRSDDDGPAELCAIDSLRVATPDAAIAANDARVKTLLHEAIRAYHRICPDVQGSIRAGLHVEPIETSTVPLLLAEPVAELDASSVNGIEGRYRNRVSERIRQQKEEEKKQVKNADFRRTFAEFTRKNGVHVWLTPRQLDENPFRWQGKTIALLVRLEKMLSADTALLVSTQREKEWQTLRVEGVSPDFPGDGQSVLVAAQFLRRENPGNSPGGRVILRHVDSQACDWECREWFLWDGAAEVKWGEPLGPPSGVR